MLGGTYFVIAILALAVIFLMKAVKVVPQGHVYTVERFGRYTHSLMPGLGIITPFIDSIGSKVNMMETVLDVPSQEVITRDNAMVKVDGVVFYQVLDAAKASYEVNNLKISYGGIQAVKGIDLTLAPGELVALIGSNGAGKTTTLKALAGLLHPASGTIHYAGKSLHNIPAHLRVRNGLALIPEGRGVFAHLSVEENLRMGAYVRRDAAEITADLARMYALFPHFRSDGWIYADIRDTNTSHEYMVASDAALLAE